MFDTPKLSTKTAVGRNRKLSGTTMICRRHVHQKILTPSINPTFFRGGYQKDKIEHTPLFAIRRPTASSFGITMGNKEDVRPTGRINHTQPVVKRVFHSPPPIIKSERPRLFTTMRRSTPPLPTGFRRLRTNTPATSSSSSFLAGDRFICNAATQGRQEA